MCVVAPGEVNMVELIVAVLVCLALVKLSESPSLVKSGPIVTVFDENPLILYQRLFSVSLEGIEGDLRC